MRDFLDSKGRFTNFVNGKPYSKSYKKVARDRWSKLPLYSNPSKVHEIVTSLNNQNVTIVISATGSGKSVIVPRMAMKVIIDKKTSSDPRMARLGMTFPKSVLAMESAMYASTTWDVVLGEEVGYQFRGSAPTSHSSQTRALFMTDGTLYTMSRKDPTFECFDIVIIDEAHERSMMTDLLMARLKKALLKRPAFRLVIMSATIDPSVFQSYFNCNSLTSSVIHIAGQPMFNISHHWERQAVKDTDLPQVTTDRIKTALTSKSEKKSGDVLVFVATTKDVKKGCQMFDKTRAGLQEVLCEGLYRKLPDEEKDAVIHGLLQPPFTKKLIFATPIAESSITFPLLSSVIDSGWQLTSRWLPREQATEIVKEMTSKAQISQRVGRVGRVSPGEVYHLYTESQYKTLKEFPTPSILNTDLTEHLLAEICIENNSVESITKACNELVSPPSIDQVLSGLRSLVQLGLVYPSPSTLTNSDVSPLGRLAHDVCTSFQMSLSHAMLMIGGAILGCKKEVLILACILEEMNGEFSELWSAEAFSTGRYRYLVRRNVDRFSDHMSMIKVYQDIYHGKEVGTVRAALNLSTWDRIETRLEKYTSKYVAFDIHRHVDIHAMELTHYLPPPQTFACDVVRAVAFSLRHRQLVFSSNDALSTSASSVGPLTSIRCDATTLLASEITRPTPCLGGIYQELLIVGKKPTFSIITWII